MASKNSGWSSRWGFPATPHAPFLLVTTASLYWLSATKDYRNILTDIKIRFYRDKSGAKLATGFSEAYALVEKQIANALAKLGPDLPLYITGHSLGGALAVIASIRIRPSDRIAACYTYGCPRVGNAEFTNELWKIPVYRQAHSADIVPRVPFGFGYRQAGDLRYIKRSGVLVEDPNPIGPFLSFVLSLVTNFKSVFGNHRIAGYVESLRAWALYRLGLDGKRQVKADSASPPGPASSPTAPKTLTASGGTRAQ